MKYWDRFSTWKDAEKAWDSNADKSRQSRPIKTLKTLPRMPGVAEENVKWKSLKYLVTNDHRNVIRKHFFKHPLRYTTQFVRSLFKKKSYLCDGDFFLYGISSIDHFQQMLEDDENILVIGFSYCHKPLECPSGRFSDACIHDTEDNVCRQCFIGKALHALPRNNAIPLVIPTIHYIGEKIFEIVHANPTKQVLFIITACELSLEMFGDWGNMVNVKGVGVRLGGRICNTMKAFELSECGVKPGLTVVLDDSQRRILDLIRHRREETTDHH